MTNSGVFSKTEYAIAQYVTFTIPDVAVQYRFQNFYIGEAAPWQGDNFTFMPFGFSGITVDRNGSNVDAGLVFPNNEISRVWGGEAIEKFWLARVRTILVDPDNKQTTDSNHATRLLYKYVGQVSAGSWDDTSMSLRLNSVLDSVRSNAPNRKLNRNTCGRLPNTNRISV